MLRKVIYFGLLSCLLLSLSFSQYVNVLTMVVLSLVFLLCSGQLVQAEPH
ncbi:hypothetical protein JGI22_00516 [Candidatus Kryptobacter tengchongensis]|nr:hypothetical protein JGI22_00516 [Candidatus Kryptobacter tengchongensis]